MKMTLAEMNRNNNNLTLITVKTNRTTLHAVNNTTYRTAATVSSREYRLPETDSTELFANNPIRWAFTWQTFTRWRHQSEVELI